MAIKKNIIKLVITLVSILLAVLGIYFVFGDVLKFISKLISLFLPFIVAYIMSLFLNPVVNRLEKHLKIPRQISAVFVILAAIGILGGIIFAVGWKITDELQSVSKLIPDMLNDARNWWDYVSSNFLNMYANLPEGVQDVGLEIGDNVVKNAGEILKDRSIPLFYGIGNFAISLPKIFVWIIVFILSLYFMVADSRKMKHYLGKCCTKRFLVKLRRVQRYLKKYLGGYVKAQLTIMCIASVILLAGLSILKVDFALLIAIGIALLDALPFFGSGAVLWPWAAISFINGDIRLGVGLIIIYLAVIFTRQMIEPKIVSEHIGIYPVFTLIAMYLGYTLFSIGGMILGPICLIIIVSFYKAGAFDDIIGFFKWLLNSIKNNIKEIYDYFK